MVRVLAKCRRYVVFDTDGRQSILCLRCALESYNQNDVDHRYCPRCHVFHLDEEQNEAAAALALYVEFSPKGRR